MKKTNLLKGIVIAMLSVVLVANLATYVFADDNLDWDTLSGNTSGNAAGNTAGNTSGNTSGNGIDFTNPESNTNTNSNNNTNSGSMSTYLNTNNNTNTNENKANTLAYTGLGNTNAFAVVIVLGAIVAVYSFKKAKEYNSL